MFEGIYFLQVLAIHGNLSLGVACAVYHHLTLLGADLHTICVGSVHQPAGQVVEFVVAASGMIYIISKAEVVDGSASD